MLEAQFDRRSPVARTMENRNLWFTDTTLTSSILEHSPVTTLRIKYTKEVDVSLPSNSSSASLER